MNNERLPVLLLVSAPSGAGKTTLCKRLLAAFPELEFSVSATTRPPREGERDGVDYHFLDRATFEQGIARGDFLEHAEVYGNLYGTPVKPVRAALSRGDSVLLDVDVQGAELIRESLRGQGLETLHEAFVDVFISPPSPECLRERLVGRGTDAPEVIERRMRNAVAELEHAPRYAYRVVNREIENAFRDVASVYRAAGLRSPSRDAV